MGRTATAAAFGACLVALIVLVVLDRRPYRPGKLNFVPLMIILAVACIVLGQQLLVMMR